MLSSNPKGKIRGESVSIGVNAGTSSVITPQVEQLQHSKR